jgi:leucyl aminopeptidase
MRAPVRIELTARPLDRVESEIAVAGFFSDERPLRGGAARADWRLCGGLSRRIVEGDLSGQSGEALLIGSGRALRAPRLLLLGLGRRADFDSLRMSDQVGAAVERCLRLGCPRIGLAPLGVAPDDVPRHAPAFVAGLRSACADGDASVHLQICVPGSEIEGVARALEEACRDARAPEIEISRPAAP